MADNTLSCQRETLHSQQLRSIKKSIDSDHGIYRETINQCPLLCRFSDAGNDELATRSGDRRPKSAKARNRGWVRSVGRAARSAMGI
jgi:hypothetical protein